MSRGRGGVTTSRSKKYNRGNQPHFTYNLYKSYDWRPKGHDGESKKPASRVNCHEAEILSRRSSPRCLTQLDIHPAGLPSYTNCSSPRSLGYSPRSTRSIFRSKKLRDYQQCDESEKFSSRVSTPHINHGEPIKQFDTSLQCSGICSRPISSKDAICLRHNCMAPRMQPAGIITRNCDYLHPPEMHSIIRLDSYVKHQGLYNGLGQLVKDSFQPRLGDAIIVKMPRMHPKKDHGYVEFFTNKREGCQFCRGDLILRVGKFVENNTWRYNKRHKLYFRTSEHHWLFIGMIDNFVNFLPVTTHGLNINHVAQHCQIFYPRRGDMIIHLNPPDRASQLQWFNPKTRIDKGDILVRMYLGEPTSQSNSTLMEVVAAAIEIYMYFGKGFGWIFMGRDDCWYKDGYDLLESTT